MKAMLIPAMAMAALLAHPALAATKAVNERGEAKLTSTLAGFTAGPPVKCIDLRQIQATEIIDGTAIVYRMYGAKLFVNRPTAGASSLRANQILITKTFSGELCDIDIVRLRDQGSNFEAGFINLGKFTPYAKVKAGGGD